MTEAEKRALEIVAARMRHLASMETARFGLSAEYDKAIKEGVGPYMQWFERTAAYIEGLTRAKDKYDTRNAINDILKYCR